MQGRQLARDERFGMTALRRFVRANQRVAERIERRLPYREVYLSDRYRETVVAHMKKLPEDCLVVDVGGGRSCVFARHRVPGDGARIVAVDVSQEELALNRDVDEKVVTDVVNGLPFEDGTVDMVVNQWVVEHLTDSEALVRHAARVLKPNGWYISLFPSKYAPFSLANRALPEPLAQRALHFVWPGTEGVVGFPTYYDNCSARAMSRVLTRHGFTIVDMQLDYYKSAYFSFFLPVYLLSALYEFLAWRLGAAQLAASVLVVARRL